MDSNGAYYMEMSASKDKPLELASILNNVTVILQQKPGTSVLVRGDTHVEYGVVVSLMAALQEAGAKDVGLITEDP